ncbi:unnamed protein product [Rhizophagus irregularis]|nr:unnamed protein product [Rhizophagus irregularis]
MSSATSSLAPLMDNMLDPLLQIFSQLLILLLLHLLSLLRIHIYTFYTDGSLINLGTAEVSMGWGWVQIVQDSGFLNSLLLTTWTNTAHTADDSVIIARLDLAAVHDFVLSYDNVVCETNPRHLLKQYHQMLYMEELLKLLRFRFLSLLTESSAYMVDWALTWHSLLFQPKHDDSFTQG